jgi:hypothetical protein
MPRRSQLGDCNSPVICRNLPCSFRGAARSAKTGSVTELSGPALAPRHSRASAKACLGAMVQTARTRRKVTEMGEKKIDLMRCRLGNAS